MSSAHCHHCGQTSDDSFGTCVWCGKPLVRQSAWRRFIGKLVSVVLGGLVLIVFGAVILALGWYLWPLLVWVLGVVAVIAAMFGVSAYLQYLEDKRFDRAYDRFRTTGHCEHELVSVAQRGIPGVFMITTKRCRVCGADLSLAKMVDGHWV